MSYTKTGIADLMLGSPFPDAHTNNRQRTNSPAPAGACQSAQQESTNPPSRAPAGDSKFVVSIAEHIIFKREGKYESITASDNGALSIWDKIEWRAGRARALLVKIKSKGVTLPQSVSDDLDKPDKFWKTRKLSDEEKKALKPSLATEASQKVQDLQATADVTGYMKVGRSLGITDNQSLVYFADLYNQRPASARKIVKAAGGGTGLTLEKIHLAALANSIMGTYKKRRKDTYDDCKMVSASPKPMNPNNAVPLSLPLIRLP